MLIYTFGLPETPGKVWVATTSADMPTDWTENVVTNIPSSSGDLYYHQQAAWEK